MALYPFDQTGLNPANRITGEVHTVNAINGANHAYFVPRNAPYFKESLTIVNADTGDMLEPNVDYEWTHHFSMADDHLARKVYGSVTLLDPNATGRFVIGYQTLGGDFVTAFTQAITDGFAALNDLRNADWTDIVGAPPVFPPTFHTQPVTDINGVMQFLDIMHQIKEAVSDPNNRLVLDDVQDLEAAFIVPLLKATQDISAAIIDRQYGESLPHAVFATSNNETSLGAKPLMQWFDIGEVIIPQTGSYMHQWHLTGRPFNEDNSNVETRILVNNAPIGNSYQNGGVTAFSTGMTITLQARVRGAAVANFWISRDLDPTTLTLLRVGM